VKTLSQIKKELLRNIGSVTQQRSAESIILGAKVNTLSHKHAVTKKYYQSYGFIYCSHHCMSTNTICCKKKLAINAEMPLENASQPDIRDRSALEVSPFHGIVLHTSTFT